MQSKSASYGKYWITALLGLSILLGVILLGGWYGNRPLPLQEGWDSEASSTQPIAMESREQVSIGSGIEELLSSSTISEPIQQDETLTVLTRKITQAYEAVYRNSQTKVALYYQDLGKETEASVGQISADQPVKSASIIKLFIMMVLLQEVKQGQLELDEPYSLQASDQVGGTGFLQNQQPGTIYSLGELAHYMIIYSDNTATNILIQRLGGLATVQEKIQASGFRTTRLQRLMMDQEAMAAGIENMSSAREVGQLLARLYHHNLVSPDLDQVFLGHLSQQEDRQGLVALLPSDVKTFNKTGQNSAQALRHDAAIIVLSEQQAYVLVALQEGGNGGQLLDQLQKVGLAIYQAVQP